MAPPYQILQATSNALSERQATALRRMTATYVNQPAASLSTTAVWGPEFFGLIDSRVFRALTTELQHALLARCGLGILQEAQLIEVAGTTYTAKMALLAGTLEQRELYSMFAADEARHLRLFAALIGEPQAATVATNSFLQFLATMIRNESAPVLVLMIQVLLEGWGIRYYGALARHARLPQVTTSLRLILDDEAKHHGSGLLLHDDAQISRQDEVRLTELVGAFLDMVRLGPLGLVAHLAAVSGGINGREITEVLAQSAALEKIATDLQMTQTLLTLAGAERLRAWFSERGAFLPPSLADCRRSLTAALGVSA